MKKRIIIIFVLLIILIDLSYAEEGIVLNSTKLENEIEEIIELNKGDSVIIIEESDWGSSGTSGKKVKIEMNGQYLNIDSRNLLYVKEKIKSVKIAIQKNAIFKSGEYFTYQILYFLNSENEILMKDDIGYRQSSSWFTGSNIDDISSEDKNSDGNNEIIIKTKYYGGYFHSDGFKFIREFWFDIDEDNVRKIFEYSESGGGMVIPDYINSTDLKLYDIDEDGFSELIVILQDVSEDVLGSNVDIVKQKYVEYEDGKYVYKETLPEKGKLIDTKVRLRESPNLNSEIIDLLMLNQEVEIIERTLKKERIENYYAPWYKVKTEDGKLGWAYSVFIEIIDGEE